MEECEEHVCKYERNFREGRLRFVGILERMQTNDQRWGPTKDQLQTISALCSTFSVTNESTVSKSDLVDKLLESLTMDYVRRENSNRTLNDSVSLRLRIPSETWRSG